MRYKTRFTDSYSEGRANVTVTLSVLAARKLQDIDNKSGYINDLIIEDLSENGNVEKKLIVAQIMKNKIELEKYGMSVNLFKIPSESEKNGEQQ